jgi:hypothetical protein
MLRRGLPTLLLTLVLGFPGLVDARPRSRCLTPHSTVRTMAAPRVYRSQRVLPPASFPGIAPPVSAADCDTCENTSFSTGIVVHSNGFEEFIVYPSNSGTPQVVEESVIPGSRVIHHGSPWTSSPTFPTTDGSLPPAPTPAFTPTNPTPERSAPPAPMPAESKTPSVPTAEPTQAPAQTIPVETDKVDTDSHLPPKPDETEPENEPIGESSKDDADAEKHGDLPQDEMDEGEAGEIAEETDKQPVDPSMTEEEEIEVNEAPEPISDEESEPTSSTDLMDEDNAAETDDPTDEPGTETSVE